MKGFLKENRSLFLLIGLIILCNGLVFLLFSFPFQVFLLLVALILIIFLLYLIRQLVYYNQQVDLKRENETLQQELFLLKESYQQEKNDLEEYFLMWVHQIKTPITASQLILANIEDDSAATLRQELLSIENYTNMALNYLKLINPVTDMTISPVSLDKIIKPLLRKYRIHFIKKEITLHYQPIDTLIITEANLTSLMIEQLLNNALKYTKSGDIWIQFDATTFQLTIQDNGIGIKKEDLPKIFDKGYSGFNGKLNEKSSGLGLYLVNLIAKRLEQAVHVDSQTDKGTSFIIQCHSSNL